MSGKIFESPLPNPPEECYSYPSLGHLLDQLLSGDKLNQTLLIDAASGRKWTGAQVREHVLNIATALLDEGLEQGQLVTIYYKHSDSTILLALGIIFAGGGLVYIHPKEPFLEVAAIAQKVEPSMLFGYQQSVEWVDQLNDKFGLNLKGVLMDESVPDEIKSTRKHFDYYLNYPREQSESSKLIPVACKDVKQDMVVVCFSSGTTGTSKVVPASHYSCIAELASALQAPISPMIYSLTTTMNYISGRIYMFEGIKFGRTNVIIDQFEPNSFARYIEQYKISYVCLGSASMYKLITSEDVDKYDISSLKVIFPSGARITYIKELKAFVEKHPNLKMIRQTYGITEVGGPLNGKYMPIEQLLEESHQCSKLTPRVKVKVVDPETGALLGVNEKGIAHVDLPTLFPGYLDMAEARKRATQQNGTKPSCYLRGPSVFDEDGYYITGDIVYFDSDDNLHVIGRHKELMLCRGTKKFMPEDLELVISQHPAVKQVCVTGIPHKLVQTLHCPRAFIVVKKECLSESIENFLTPRLDSSKKEELVFTGDNKLSSLPDSSRRKVSIDIIDFVNERVSYYSQLTGGVVILDTVPILTRSGKIDKRYLTQLNESQVEFYGDRTGCDKEH